MSMRNPGNAVPASLATPRSLSEEPTQAALDHDASPLELALDHQDVQRYEEALLRLTPRDRRAVRGRFEEQQSYGCLAEALGLTTATVARAAVVRALGRLIAAMSP